MADINETIKLARAFGSEVQEMFTRAELRTVIKRNRDSDRVGCCATHDFCDANMLMLKAFVNTFGRDPLDGPEGMTEADTLLWNDAWAVAKAAEFFA